MRQSCRRCFPPAIYAVSLLTALLGSLASGCNERAAIGNSQRIRVIAYIPISPAPSVTIALTDYGTGTCTLVYFGGPTVLGDVEGDGQWNLSSAMRTRDLAVCEPDEMVDWPQWSSAVDATGTYAITLPFGGSTDSRLDIAVELTFPPEDDLPEQVRITGSYCIEIDAVDGDDRPCP